MHMPRHVTSNVRILFSSLSVTLLLFAGIESAAARTGTVETSACGGSNNPCRMVPVMVSPPPVAEVPGAVQATPAANTVAAQPGSEARLSAS